MTPREKFLAVLTGQPLLRGDAVAVFCGEDGLQRTHVGCELMASQAAGELWLMGGIEDYPAVVGANGCLGEAYGKGIAPGKVHTETASQNTRDQAVALCDLIAEHEWKRVLLVASGYHIFRAYLTTLDELLKRDLDEACHLLPVPATQLPWFEGPEGIDLARIDLLGVELDKIERYGVAIYGRALTYMQHWEGK